MSIGHAIDELMELLRLMEHEMTIPQKRAMRILANKGDKLRERRQDLRTARMCDCGHHRRKRGNVVCWQCFANAPEAIRAALKHGDSRVALRELMEFAQSRREHFATVSPGETNTTQTI